MVKLSLLIVVLAIIASNQGGLGNIFMILYLVSRCYILSFLCLAQCPPHYPLQECNPLPCSTVTCPRYPNARCQ